MTLLNVPDMTCGHCKATVETALRGVDADADILVDLAAKTVSVTSKAPTPALINALAAAGYPATIPRNKVKLADPVNTKCGHRVQADKLGAANMAKPGGKV